MATFHPATNLRSRTFLGLLVAQFLAAFNDQAIHASAMFFAIKHKTLTEADAISLMPILFYAPWAIFGTLAGWLADRYSKRQSLIFWKIAEVAITGLALLGFWLGCHGIAGQLGPWLVLSTVFLMGTHSTFFVPAKYGCMPEILEPHLLSKGNGLLESLSFLAVILGTVCGGVMSYLFGSYVVKDQEYWIGVVLVGLALIGAVASFLIARMPAANPTRPFPVNLVKPIADNLKIMLKSRPVALSVVGIAFFTFVLVYMRGTMYMHGETRNPRWNELETSLIVGTVAFGIGIGSPMAGFLSGGKVELGLVPFGSLGMILALTLAGVFLGSTVGLVACLIAVGFFTSFYLVPMFTLLQHRAPKKSKGDLLATSNVINVTGAIIASLLFKGLVAGAALIGVTPAVPVEPVARGTLRDLKYDEHGRPESFDVELADGEHFTQQVRRRRADDTERRVLKDNGKPALDSQVVVGRYSMERGGKKVTYYVVQPEALPLGPEYDREPLTRYLFLGAAGMTACILFLLWIQLPDIFLRTLLWLRSLRRKITVLGMQHLPTSGPVILTTNCESLETGLQVLAAVDRYGRFLFVESKGGERISKLIRALSGTGSLAIVRSGAASGPRWEKIEARADQALQRGYVIGLPLNGGDHVRQVEELIEQLGARWSAEVVPVYCEIGPSPEGRGGEVVYVVFGATLPAGTPAQTARTEVQRLGDELKEKLRQGVDLSDLEH